MDSLLKNSLINLKKNIMYSYNPLAVSRISMDIINENSKNINPESYNKLLMLVAMDMGEEFELDKDRALELVDGILAVLNK